MFINSCVARLDGEKAQLATQLHETQAASAALQTQLTDQQNKVQGLQDQLNNAQGIYQIIIAHCCVETKRKHEEELKKRTQELQQNQEATNKMKAEHETQLAARQQQLQTLQIEVNNTKRIVARCYV